MLGTSRLAPFEQVVCRPDEIERYGERCGTGPHLTPVDSRMTDDHQLTVHRSYLQKLALTRAKGGARSARSRQAMDTLAWVPSGLDQVRDHGLKSGLLLFRQRVSYMAFSPNGKYLATAGEDLNVLVWSTTPDDRHVVSRTAIKEGVVTGIVFYPSAKANIIAFIDTQGQLTRWDDVVPSNLPLPTAMPAARQREERSVSVAATDASGDVVSKRRILPKKSAAGTAAAATAATSTTEKRAGGDDDNKSEFGDMFDDDQGWLEDDDDMLGGVTGRGDDDDHAGLMARIPPRLGANGAGGATGGYTSRLDSARDYDCMFRIARTLRSDSGLCS